MVINTSEKISVSSNLDLSRIISNLKQSGKYSRGFCELILYDRLADKYFEVTHKSLVAGSIPAAATIVMK